MIRWIASYPKSGSTWVRLFLMAYQLGNKFDMNKRPPGYYWDINPAFYRKVSPVPLDRLSPGEVMSLRPATLVHLARMHGGRPFVKTHVANLTVNREIRLIPPTLTERTLYLLRDPRDVAVSYAAHRDTDIDTIVELMANPRAVRSANRVPTYMSDWSRHVQSFRKTEFPCLMVRYEDLHAAAFETFTKILDFFDIEPDSGRVERAIAATRFEALQAREAADGYIGRPESRGKFFRRGQVGGWADDLTPEQVARIESAHGAQMQLADYTLSNPAAADASSVAFRENAAGG